MKPTINPDGTRTHELSAHEKKQVCRVLELLDHIAFHYRDERNGPFILGVARDLATLAHIGTESTEEAE